MYNFLLGCVIGAIITNLLWYIHDRKVRNKK